MSIYIGDKKIKDLYIGDTSPSEIYVGDIKVRPTIINFATQGPAPYGFPGTGTIANTSTTQVDTSTYGPGNYYSSDTFIKYNGRWDSTDNGNLWGGEDGNVPV